MKLITDPDIIAGYLTDASNTRGHAQALARPRSAEEVAEILEKAQSKGVPVTVTAQRTATTGAPVPQGGWLLSTEKLDRIHSVEEAEAGVILGRYQDFAEERGRLYPPDPTSRYDCSLGGSIACNASGARSFRYGPTRGWVEEVEVVLPTGEIVTATRDTPLPAGWAPVRWEEPQVKTAAGYAPTDKLLDLIIGSEGTLGVVTRARMKLVDPPAGVLSFLAFFPDRDALLALLERARAGATRRGRPPATPGDLDPQAIEYYGPHALDMVRQRVPEVPPAARGCLFIEVPYDDEPPLEAWWDALVDCGALAEDTIVADDDSGRRRLREVRHAVPAGINEQLVRSGMPKVGTDFAVPDGALAQMMDAYDQVELPKVCFGHIGDNHLHLNLLPRSPSQLDRARGIYKELAHRALELGGTVSAEHGIGRIKRGLLADMVGPQTLAAFRRLKGQADPNWILGRGALLAPPDQA